MSAPGCCVVVTGAASGIGRAVSIELEKRGHVTALWDMDKVCIGPSREQTVQYVRDSIKKYEIFEYIIQNLWMK